MAYFSIRSLERDEQKRRIQQESLHPIQQNKRIFHDDLIVYELLPALTGNKTQILQIDRDNEHLKFRFRSH